jgi:hypothetical protein
MSVSEIEDWKELIKHPESFIESDINEPWEKFPLALQDENYIKSFLKECFEINSDSVEYDSCLITTGQTWASLFRCRYSYIEEKGYALSKS